MLVFCFLFLKFKTTNISFTSKFLTYLYPFYLQFKKPSQVSKTKENKKEFLKFLFLFLFSILLSKKDKNFIFLEQKSWIVNYGKELRLNMLNFKISNSYKMVPEFLVFKTYLYFLIILFFYNTLHLSNLWQFLDMI